MYELKVTGETPDECANKIIQFASRLGKPQAGSAKMAPPEQAPAPAAAPATGGTRKKKGTSPTPTPAPAVEMAGFDDGGDPLSETIVDDTPAVTREQVQEKLKELKAQFEDANDGNAAVIKVLVEACGTKKFGEVPNEKIPALFAAVQKALAE